MIGLKSQSAIEFLTTYGFVFLIIAVAISVLFFFINIPSSTINTSCNFYSSFSCADISYSLLGSLGGSQLVVIVTDSQPGVVNTTSFNAVINNQPSTKGYCVPQFSSQGQTMYCVANFSYSPPIGNIYTGTYIIKANYCTPGVTNISYSSCRANSNYSYGGTFRVQAVNATIDVSGVGVANAVAINTHYLPVTVINPQNTPTTVPFVLFLNFTPSNSVFHAYEDANLGNIRFYYNGRELQSWCHTGCQSGWAGTAMFVKFPASIPPSSNIIMDLYFLPKFVNYDHFAGLNPQAALNNYWAQYDNGASVFPFYDNFVGNTLSPLWTVITGNVFVGNGLILGQSTIGTSRIEAVKAAFKVPLLFTAFLSAATVGTANDFFDISFAPASPTNQPIFNGSLRDPGEGVYFPYVTGLGAGNMISNSFNYVPYQGSYSQSISDKILLTGNSSSKFSMTISTFGNANAPGGYNTISTAPEYNLFLSSGQGPIYVEYVLERQTLPGGGTPNVVTANIVNIP